MKYFILAFFLSIAFVKAQAQDSSIFAYPVKMDSVIVRAARGGWDVQGFINRVKNDTTFYKAFRALHLVSYSATNDIDVLDRKNETKASLYSHTKQYRTRGCRSMKVLDEKTTGDFYTRRHNYNYFTAELYAYLFFTKDTVCNENDIVAGALSVRGSGTIEKSKYQLKQLIFNPGGKIGGIPFIGNKASIFDPEIAKLYDFKLSSVEYAGEDCYLFQAIPKKEHLSEVVYNELSAWFRKSDYSILARDYALSFNAGIYDFDVRMKVRLAVINGRLLPSNINYDGNWHVFTKSREHVKFNAGFVY